MYIPGQSSDFLNWLKGEQGRKVVSENQTRYINNSKSLLSVVLGPSQKPSFGWWRTAKLEKLELLDKVEKMIFPTTDASQDLRMIRGRSENARILAYSSPHSSPMRPRKSLTQSE